jgi:hypothetical protein
MFPNYYEKNDVLLIDKYLHKMVINQAKANKATRANMKKTQKREEREADRRLINISRFSEGQAVLVFMDMYHTKDSSRRIERRSIGPYVIEESLENGRFYRILEERKGSL